MTSLVPPLLVALAVVPVFAFAVAFLAGTLFPSCNPFRNNRRPGSVCSLAHRTEGQILPRRVEAPVNYSTIGPMAEYAYLVVYLPRGTSRDARDTARRILTGYAEYGDWELSRLRINADGSRKATLRRRIIRPVRTL